MDDPDIAERARKLFSGPIDFLKSAPKLEHLPDPTVPEIAFAGRSNVGKSSLINAVTNRNKLARASNTPGRTQELNYFDVGKPAGVPAGRHARLRLRRSAQGHGQALALPDQRLSARAAGAEARAGAGRRRHGLKDVDRDVMKMLDDAAVSYHLVLTKADKVKPTELAKDDRGDPRRSGEASGRPPAHPADLQRNRRGIAELRTAILEAVASLPP